MIELDITVEAAMTLLMSAGHGAARRRRSAAKLAALAEAARGATRRPHGRAPQRGESTAPAGSAELINRPQQPDRLVALEQIEQVPQRLAARRWRESGSRDSISAASSRAALDQLAVHLDARDAEARHAACRVPSTSPSPRSRKSSSAMRKPSSVSRMIASRALAVSPSGAL